MKKQTSQEFDLALIEAIKKGGREADKAFAKLFRKYYDKIKFKMLVNTGNNGALAEDLAADVLARVYEKLESYSPKYAFSTWIHTVANNLYTDYIRTVKVEILSIEKLKATDEDGEEMGFQLESDARNPEQVMIQNQLGDVIDDFIENIKNSTTRKIAELRFYGDMSYEDIATEVGCPVGTVKGTIFRARRDISNLLKNKSVDELITDNALA